MKFGPVPLSRAQGAISAHTVRHAGATIKKGQVLLNTDIEALARAGIKEIIVARLQPGDVHEDKAACALADALSGAGLRVDRAFTGRVNIFAVADGIFLADPQLIARLNRVDEAITLATLPPFAQARGGQMAATVKIIPYAVREKALARALVLARKATPVLKIAPLRPRKAGLVATRVDGTREKVLAKTARLLEERLGRLGSSLGKEIRCAHDADEIARAVAMLRETGHDPIIVFGASAIIDRRDMVPAGIRKAGGRILRFGMPVDPGNLLLLAMIDDVPVIGAPGCARSPKENGFDWVLQRLLADIPVTAHDMTALGAGGLLMEIETRPQPRVAKRAAQAAAPRIVALVLAAGRSRRMGGPNKLVQDLAGKPLVRHAAEAALASRADRVIVVTGHMEEAVRSALAGLDVSFVRNPDFAEGLSSSLKAGLDALPEAVDAVLVCLGDMPAVTPAMLDRLMAAFAPDEGRLIAVPTCQGKRGNPVLFSTRFVAELKTLRGDVGARHLIGEHDAAVVEVETGAAAVLDIDTPQALENARRQPSASAEPH